MSHSTRSPVLLALAVVLAVSGAAVDAKPRYSVLKATVLTGEDYPLQGAELVVMDADGVIVVTRSVTDASGELRLFLESGKRHDVTISLAGFLTVRLPDVTLRDAHHDGAELEIHMPIDWEAVDHRSTKPGPGVVQGSVVDEDGDPLPDARVTILGATNDVYPDPSSGAFHVPLDPGDYRVTISCEGYFTVEYPEIVIPEAVTTIDLPVVLYRDRSKPL